MNSGCQLDLQNLIVAPPASSWQNSLSTEGCGTPNGNKKPKQSASILKSLLLSMEQTCKGDMLVASMGVLGSYLVHPRMGKTGTRTQDLIS